VHSDHVIVVRESAGDSDMLALATTDPANLRFAVNFDSRRVWPFQGQPNNNCRPDRPLPGALSPSIFWTGPLIPDGVPFAASSAASSFAALWHASNGTLAGLARFPLKLLGLYASANYNIQERCQDIARPGGASRATNLLIRRVGAKDPTLPRGSIRGRALLPCRWLVGNRRPRPAKTMRWFFPKGETMPTQLRFRRLS
jgi:hypothetical protein